MRAGQKSIGSNGKENILFPLDILNITQGELVSGDTHEDTWNIDYIGTTTRYPYYAPVSCKVVYTSSSNGITIIESLDEVNYIDGRVDYFQAMFWHNDNLLYQVGDVLSQGDLLGHTGTTGQVTGDHVHVGIGTGKYQGMTTSPEGHSILYNQYHQYDAFGINDTTIRNTWGYSWKEFPDSPPPPPAPVQTEINDLLLGVYKKWI